MSRALWIIGLPLRIAMIAFIFVILSLMRPYEFEDTCDMAREIWHGKSDWQ